MNDKIAKNLQAFVIAVNAHDRENDCTASGIAMARFDVERLGLEDGEEILPGITLSIEDGRQTGTFRIVCDGEHLVDVDEAQTSEPVRAIARQP